MTARLTAPAAAREDRVTAGQVEAGGVALHDGNLAGAGDWIVTRRNNRRLRTRGGRAWVQNGDAWRITARHPDGSLTQSESLATLASSFQHALEIAVRPACKVIIRDRYRERADDIAQAPGYAQLRRVLLAGEQAGHHPADADAGSRRPAARRHGPRHLAELPLQCHRLA